MKKTKTPARNSAKTVPPPEKVKIRLLPTGVRGLDEIMGGGLPEFSFNIVADAPGCGKTTLAHQIIFANAMPEKPALYFTVRGETHSTLGIAALRDKLTRIEIAATGCDCKACGLAAYEIVAKVEGVAQAAVSFREGRITALIDPEKTSRAALEDALKKTRGAGEITVKP